MVIRFMIILFFISVVCATAGIIGGFEPVWEKEEPIVEPSSSIGKQLSPGTTPRIRQTRKTGPLGRTWTEPITGMEFVWVEGGCYQMGCGSNSKYSQNQSDELPASIADIPAWQWPLAVVAALLPVGCARSSRPSHYQSTDCNNDEQPMHEVCVDGFYMGKYEVTQGQYQKIAGSNPPKFGKGSNYPVEKVSWDDAQSYIKNLNSRSSKSFRLPTEAEWEYAARNGRKLLTYSKGNSQELQTDNVVATQEEHLKKAREERRKAADFFVMSNRTSDFDSKIELLIKSRQSLISILVHYPLISTGMAEKVKHNIERVEKEINSIAPNLIDSKLLEGEYIHQVGKVCNKLGLCEILENVNEWCSDWYDADYYESSPRNNPQGPSSGSDRVFRGGSWRDWPADVRAIRRSRLRATLHNGNMGFRLISLGQ